MSTVSSIRRSSKSTDVSLAYQPEIPADLNRDIRESMASANKDNCSSYRVNSVSKALDVLGCVVENGYDTTLAEVARELRLPKPTAFRYLQTLVASGYVSRHQGANTYSVGPKFSALARRSEVLRRLKMASRPEIERVAALFGQTVNLGILEDGGIVYLDMVELRRYPEIKARVGSQDAVHATALGKAIIAHLPESERRLWLDKPLAEKTMRTITDRSRFERELTLVSKRGYAVDTGENEVDAMCVGVPILCGPGYPVAAMSLTARIGRRAAISEKCVTQELLNSAATVSSELNRTPWFEYISVRSPSLADS